MRHNAMRVMHGGFASAKWVLTFLLALVQMPAWALMNSISAMGLLSASLWWLWAKNMIYKSMPIRCLYAVHWRRVDTCKKKYRLCRDCNATSLSWLSTLRSVTIEFYCIVKLKDVFLNPRILTIYLDITWTHGSIGVCIKHMHTGWGHRRDSCQILLTELWEYTLNFRSSLKVFFSRRRPYLSSEFYLSVCTVRTSMLNT